MGLILFIQKVRGLWPLTLSHATSCIQILYNYLKTFFSMQRCHHCLSYKLWYKHLCWIRHIQCGWVYVRATASSNWESCGIGLVFMITLVLFLLVYCSVLYHHIFHSLIWWRTVFATKKLRALPIDSAALGIKRFKKSIFVRYDRKMSFFFWLNSNCWVCWRRPVPFTFVCGVRLPPPPNVLSQPL